MKFIAPIILTLIIISCKQEVEPVVEEISQRYVDVDTSSNEVVHLSDLEDNYHSLQEVIDGHKGKVIYMDIWASWCGPCKAEMPASHKLQEKYKDSDVIFLYVSIDRNNKAWETSAQQFQLTENSYLARNYPKAKLFQTNNVRTIPRYMLFDKKGKLVDSDASRPSSTRIVEVIDAFLSI